MSKTKIEWADATWNPVTGCTKVTQGCKHCYAERMAKRLAGRAGYPPAPHQFDVTLHPDRLDIPLHWRKPRSVFVCSMSDLFHDDVPGDFIRFVFDVMNIARHHTFMVLTKRAERMAELLTRPDWPLPSNVWVGVTTENQAMFDRCVPHLMRITCASVRFVSAEPLLGPVDIGISLGLNAVGAPIENPFVQWVIVGGESGPGARKCHPSDVEFIRDQCLAAGVSFFFKQWGAWLPVGGPEVYGFERVGKKRAGRVLDGRTWDAMPDQNGEICVPM